MTTDDVRSFIVFPNGRVVVFLPETLFNVIAFIPRDTPSTDEMIVLQLVKLNIVSVRESHVGAAGLSVRAYTSRPCEVGTIVFRIAQNASSGLERVST